MRQTFFKSTEGDRGGYLKLCGYPQLQAMLAANVTRTSFLVCRDGKVFIKAAKRKTSIGTGFKGVSYFDWLEMRGRVLKPTIIEMKKKDKKILS